jgi:hypothetical protein
MLVRLSSHTYCGKSARKNFDCFAVCACVAVSCDNSVLLPSNPPNNSVAHTPIAIVVIAVVDSVTLAVAFCFAVVILVVSACFSSSFYSLHYSNNWAKISALQQHRRAMEVEACEQRHE